MGLDSQISFSYLMDSLYGPSSIQRVKVLKVLAVVRVGALSGRELMGSPAPKSLMVLHCFRSFLPVSIPHNHCPISACHCLCHFVALSQDL